MNGYYDYTKYRLKDNGLTVVLKKRPTKTVAGVLKINKGAMWEKDGEEGLNHLEEHCIARAGSEKYTPEMIRGIREYLVTTNAGTGIDDTVFVADVLTKKLLLWMYYVSDAVFRPTFRKDKVEEERHRLIQEIEESQSRPTYEIEKIFREAMYKVSPLRRDISNDTDTVRRFTIKDLKRYRSDGFCPNNATLFLVGGLPDNIEELIGDAFSHIPKGKFTTKKPPKEGKLEHFETELYVPGLVNKVNPERSRALINIGFRAPNCHDKDYYATWMMSSILGKGPKSRLFKRISQDKGLVYGLELSYTSKLGGGSINISMNVNQFRVNEALGVIFDEFQKLKERGISGREFRTEKETLEYGEEKSFENNGALIPDPIGIISALYFHETSGITIEEYKQGYERLTPGDILNAARASLPPRDGRYVLVVGKPGKKPD